MLNGEKISSFMKQLPGLRCKEYSATLGIDFFFSFFFYTAFNLSASDEQKHVSVDIFSVTEVESLR